MQFLNLLKWEPRILLNEALCLGIATTRGVLQKVFKNKYFEEHQLEVITATERFDNPHFHCLNLYWKEPQRLFHQKFAAN